MLYPNDIEIKLGFDKIRELLEARCSSPLGKEMVSKVRFSSNVDLIKKLLAQTDEFSKIIGSSISFPSLAVIDIKPYLKKSKTEGAFCLENELLEIAKTVFSYHQSIEFFNSNSKECPELYELGMNINSSLTLHSKISATIDEDARIRDTASPRLLEIRTSLKERYSQVRRSLQSIFKKSVSDGYVPEGASITVRDGRMVIPILAEHKRRIPGFIHDESASGNTIFLEPASVLQGNNEIRELEYSEKREVIKILVNLTDQVRFHLDELLEGISYLSKLDFIKAKAKLSIEFGSCIPTIDSSPKLIWKNAKHPLLKISLEKEGKKVVPLNIGLTKEDRILIISGPNAGGKSVSLKTVGLLQYMIQCGIPIMVDEDSACGVFNDILIDIGDEQSLENDLSTYSSHLKSMSQFLRKGNSASLCLIDEFGTGTDPQFGGAIAQAVLNQLNTLGVFGVVTTHYSNIKHFAENAEGIINGAMRFDMKKLEPLFELEMGKPGSSFSLEIAKKTGLGNEVIDYAKELIGEKAIDVDDLINQLEKQKQQIASRDQKLKERETQVNKLEKEYRSLKEELDSNKKAILSKAKEEAAKLLKDTNKEIEKTIRHIKSNNAQKSETKKARERLNTLKDSVVPKTEKNVIKKVDTDDLKVGDTVRIVDQDVTGLITAIKGKDAEVQIGLLKSKIKVERLEKISKGKEKTIKKERVSTAHGLNLTSKLSEFNTTLDVRGKRAEEVMVELDQFLDDAILFGLNEVKVLHGKGNGILREVVRNYCKSQNYVSSVTDEHVERGGAGISVIQLK